MWCDVDPDKVSALQSNDDEDIEQVEANGRGNEQVHGGGVRRMVTQEGAPSRGGRFASASICGRPPRERDFQRQYRRNPARCHRTRVSGRTIVMALRTDGNHRYSWMKNKRSSFMSRTRPRTFRRNMIS